MIRCDACGAPCEFVSFIGGVALCRLCVAPWNERLLLCRSPQAYQDLVRRIRREVLLGSRESS